MKELNKLLSAHSSPWWWNFPLESLLRKKCWWRGKLCHVMFCFIFLHHQKNRLCSTTSHCCFDSAFAWVRPNLAAGLGCLMWNFSAHFGPSLGSINLCQSSIWKTKVHHEFIASKSKPIHLVGFSYIYTSIDLWTMNFFLVIRKWSSK